MGKDVIALAPELNNRFLAQLLDVFVGKGIYALVFQKQADVFFCRHMGIGIWLVDLL